MNLPILPKKVDLDLAITELGLDHMPIIRGIKTLLLYSIDYELSIYFDDTIEGVNSDIEFGEIFTGDIEDGSYDFIDFRPITAGDITLIHGAKKIESASVNATGNTLDIYFSRFSQNGKQYNIFDTSSRAQRTFLSFAYDKFYINKEDILNFKNKIDNKGIHPKPSNKPDTNTSISSEIKALALLAREKAIASPGFRKGNNVNTKAFKDHIVKLASTYDTEVHGLKSIDEKINKALDKHELRELPMQKFPD